MAPEAKGAALVAHDKEAVPLGIRVMAGAAPDVAAEELYLRGQLVYWPVRPAVLAPGLDIGDPYGVAQPELVRIMEERAVQEDVLDNRVPAREGVVAGKAEHREGVHHDSHFPWDELQGGGTGGVGRAERELVQLVFELVMAH